MITETKLPPIKGYVVREDENGEQYYYKLNNTPDFNNRIVIKRDTSLNLSSSINNLYRVTLLGGGGSRSKGLNGENASVEIRIVNIEPNTDVDILIGKAGSNGSNGGTTMFGKYCYALGGEAGNNTDMMPYNYIGEEYGRGETEDLPATDGLCIIEFCS